MRAEEAKEITEEKRRKKAEEAHKYAEKHSQPALRKILRRIKEASGRFNEIQMGIAVESLAATGQWQESEFRKKLLADKIITALAEMGYTVVSSTTSGSGFLTNPTEALLGAPAVIVPTIITTWTIKW